MFIFGVLPLFAALAPIYVFLWGWPAALFHTFFDIALSLLLIELLLVKFHRIPFTCSYLPGKSNITALWFVYWLGFATYAYSMASLEAWILERPLRMAGFYLLGCALVVTAYVYRNRHLAEGFTLVFEDQPEPVVRNSEPNRPRQLVGLSAACRLPSAFCLLLSASCRLPPAACLLPPASCILK